MVNTLWVVALLTKKDTLGNNMSWSKSLMNNTVVGFTSHDLNLIGVGFSSMSEAAFDQRSPLSRGF